MTPEFDHYTISRVLGEGGMGLVYLAHDRRTGLPVAIKVISRSDFDPELRARFLKENRILSSLNHRNIVRCYEITESREGVPSIVMEYVDGVDFRAFEGRPYPELLPLMIQALMGLAYLRSQNVLHRDLSSNNIFVTLENRTRVTKILDFGVAKSLQQQALEGDVKTRTGQFLGKFAFASPEHFLGQSIDWRSDVYSLGVIFHRLLTKTPPLTVARKSNYFDWMTAHQKENSFEILAPAGAPPLPEALQSVVRRMLARRPDDRPQSYEEVIHVLDRIQRGVPPSLEPDPEELRTLPPPVEGRIGSSGPPSPPPAGRFFPADEEAETPLAEESQQKRWPDLDVRESHTERFVPRPIPEAPAEPAPPPEVPPRESSFVSGPLRTELLPPPETLDATKTATTVSSPVPDRVAEIPMWTGGAAKGPSPEPAGSSSPVLEEKTERLDDVIERLRQLEPPPVAVPPPPEPLPEPPPSRPASRPGPPTAAAPPAAPPSRSSERPTTPPPRSSERPAAAPPKPARRLVVYGEPPAAVAPPRVAPRAPAPAPPAPAPDPTGRRIRAIGIGLIIAAIVVLFAAVLWVLVAFLRAPAGGPRRSGLAIPAGGFAAVCGSVQPKPQ